VSALPDRASHDIDLKLFRLTGVIVHGCGRYHRPLRGLLPVDLEAIVVVRFFPELLNARASEPENRRERTPRCATAFPACAICTGHEPRGVPLPWPLPRVADVAPR